MLYFFDRQSDVISLMFDVISLMCEDNQSITNTYLVLVILCNTGTRTPGTGTCAIVSQPSEP